MAIDRTGISSLETGAHDITYSGNEGPKSPEQKQMMAFDDTPVFELRSLDLLMDEFREDNDGRDPFSIDELRRYFYNKYGPEGIAQVEKAVQQAEQRAQLEQREGIQMASAADPMLEEEYQKYVFEMQEQGIEPMSFEEFRRQAVAGMAMGGRVGLQWGGPPGGGETSYGSGAATAGSVTGQRSQRERDDAGVTTPYKKTNTGYVPQSHSDWTITKKDIEKKSIKEKINEWNSNQRKKSILRNMFHVAKGRPIQPALMAMLQGTMTEDEFEEKFGVSVEGLIGLSPMEQTNIFGDMSQFDKDRLSEMAGVYGQDYVSQDDWTKAFYGPKGPPDLTGGGDGPQPIIYPYETASVPGTDTPVDIDPVTGFPTDRIAFKQETDPEHQAILEEIYGGTLPAMFRAADGGRIGYAYGGDVRQNYGLGKLVKKIGRTIKKVAKSPIGMAALGTLGFGLAGMGPAKGLAGLKGKWLSSLIGNKAFKYGIPHTSVMQTGRGTTGLLGKLLLKGGADKWSMANLSPWKTIGLGSLLGGAYTAMTEDEEEENDLMKQWLADKARWDQQFAPVGDPANFQRIRFAADGGRIGYDNGGSASDRYEAKIKELMDKGMSREMAEALVISELSPDAHRILEKDGGRIGYAEGGNDDLDHRQKYLEGVKYAQEGGLMDMGGMEKDYRNEGGFVPLGREERADDVPARLSKNEFVFTADAVRAAGGGDIDKGAEVMENVMENLEKGGNVSEESQGLEGARNMFATSQRLEGVL